MKTNFIEQTDILDLEKQLGVEVTIYERTGIYEDDMRFFAALDKTDVKGDSVLIRVFGNGGTPLMAVIRYCQEISNKTIVIYEGVKRKEVKLGRIVVSEGTKQHIQNITLSKL